AANLEIKSSHGRDTRSGARIALLARQCWHAAALPPLISSFSEPALIAARDTARELPRGPLVDALPADWVERCARLGVVPRHANAGLAAQPEVVSVRHAGLWLVLYTENGPQRPDQLFSWGVDGIVTDRPDLLSPPSARSWRQTTAPNTIAP